MRSFLGKSGCGHVASETCDRFERSDRLAFTSNLFAPLVWGRPTYIWQPWPVEAPAIDRVKIHWPSDDWPPAPEAPSPSADATPAAQVVYVIGSGNLIDVWG